MKKLITLVVVFFIVTGFADAKWWIFGKSNDDVAIKYMTINSVSADESAQNITLFKENIKDNKIIIKGKALAGKGADIGSVRVSIDGKNTWQDAKFTPDGNFEFSFIPEEGRDYKVYIEITNTAGKTNDVESTMKVIKISTENISSKIKEVLDSLFQAYSSENLSKFMSYVASDFAGDRDFLELAVKKDFDALSNINLKYSINNIASSPKGVFVSLTYNRTVLVNKTGQITTDNGMTEMVFKMDNNKPLLYSMKKPLLFGLSDAENVATGETPGGGESLVLDDTGNIGGDIITVNISCSGENPYLHPIYYFSTGNKGCHRADDMDKYGKIAESIIYTSYMELHDNGMVKVFDKSLSNLTSSEVKNTTGYEVKTNFDVSLGKSYGIYIYNKFYAIEFISLPADFGQQNTTFRLKSY
ncbi:MAG: hypothetical protein GX445_01000 [Elusimicrobia bacterium]|nr:hypothetical protein [Elusimicrobiota bacterium]